MTLANTSNFQVYGYARKFSKIGIADAIVDSLRAGLSSPHLVSACITLKAIAVNVREVTLHLVCSIHFALYFKGKWPLDQNNLAGLF